MAKCLSAFFWGGAFIIGIYLTIILVEKIWLRKVAKPVETLIHDYFYPISNVDFPAVTICNNNKVYAPAMQKILKKMLVYYPNGHGGYLPNALKPCPFGCS